MAQAEVRFFKKRRKMELGDFHSLKSRGGERRIKLQCRVPLSNRPAAGVPDWIMAGYEFVVKDEFYYDRTNCKGVKLEGMSIDFFTTDEVKGKMRTLNSCTLDRFAVLRVGDNEKAEVYLTFIAYAPCGKEIIAWAYDYQGATVYAEFDATQASLSYGGEDDEDEDEVPGDLVGKQPALISGDPNDNPDAPIPNDSRHVTLPGDAPGKSRKAAASKKPAKKAAKKK